MYLEKRDKNGLVLSFQAFKKAKEISDYSFNRITKTKVYEVLAQELCKDSLDNYYNYFFILMLVFIPIKSFLPKIKI